MCGTPASEGLVVCCPFCSLLEMPSITQSHQLEAFSYSQTMVVVVHVMTQGLEEHLRRQDVNRQDSRKCWKAMITMSIRKSIRLAFPDNLNSGHFSQILKF
jgi:hypothetical protein